MKTADSLIKREHEKDLGKGEAVRRMFASIAPRYDLLNRLLSFGIDRSWRRKTVLVSLRPGHSRVLDVCAGTADLSLEYAKALGEGHQIVASDFCHEMLLLARAKLRRNQLRGNVSVCQADALQLPFPDGMFDIACVGFGIRNVADVARAIREMSRVTRSGGQVVILEFSQPHNRFFGALYQFYFLKILPLIGRLLSGSAIDAYRYLPESVMAFLRPEELARMMEDAGLSAVRIHSIMFGAVTIHCGAKP